ncbi:MAG: hypothetical protein ACRDQA_04780, partial [Nocardioidaceae bacterium]
MRAAVLVIAVLLAVSACSSAEDVRAAGPTLDPPGPEPTSSGPTNIQPTNTQPTNTEPTNTEP